MIIVFTGDCLNPFRNIVHPTKIYELPKDIGKGPMKSMPQTSKRSTIKMGFIGI